MEDIVIIKKLLQANEFSLDIQELFVTETYKQKISSDGWVEAIACAIKEIRIKFSGDEVGDDIIFIEGSRVILTQKGFEIKNS